MMSWDTANAAMGGTADSMGVGVFDGDKTSGRKTLMGAATIGAIAGGPAGGCVKTTVGACFDAYDAHKDLGKVHGQIAMLEGFLKRYRNQSSPEVVEAVEWLINKRRRRARYDQADRTVLGQAGTAIVRGGRAVRKYYKGTKGVNRHHYALVLWEGFESRDPLARPVVNVILEKSIAEHGVALLEGAMASSR